MNKLYDNISNDEKYLLNNIYRRKRGLSSKNYIYKNNITIDNSKKNLKYLKPTINNKSKKLASIHDKKVEKEYNDYFNTFNQLNFDNDNNKNIKILNLNKSEFFQSKSKNTF